MGIILLFQIHAPQISLQRQLTNVLRLPLALIISERVSYNPPFDSGGGSIALIMRALHGTLNAGVWESEEPPRGWVGGLINAKINSPPGNGTSCWDLLIVSRAFCRSSSLNTVRNEFGVGIIPFWVKGVVVEQSRPFSHRKWHNRAQRGNRHWNQCLSLNCFLVAYSAD